MLSPCKFCVVLGKEKRDQNPHALFYYFKANRLQLRELALLEVYKIKSKEKKPNYVCIHRFVEDV